MGSLATRIFRYGHLHPQGTKLQRKSSSFGGREPWLMIEHGAEDTFKKFYSLVDEQVVAGSWGLSGTVVGSSHGWLALYENRRKKGSWGPRRCSAFDLFLRNPIPVFYDTIYLPPVENRPTKVILSCRPNHEYEVKSWLAIMSYGPEKRLTYCWPGRSKHWTPIGDLCHENEPINERLGLTRVPRVYEDFVYSTTAKRLFCATKYDNFECWDLQDPFRPKMIWKKNIVVDAEYFYAMNSKKYLVFAERSGRLFVVRLNVIGFDVDELNVDPEGRGEEVIKRHMDDGCLDGMSFFIGSAGHGFVLENDEVIKYGMEPNCIYLADPKELTLLLPWEEDKEKNKVAYGCIFNYENKTFSPCYYHTPCDDIQSDKRRSESAPMWFTPYLLKY